MPTSDAARYPLFGLPSESGVAPLPDRLSVTAPTSAMPGPHPPFPLSRAFARIARRAGVILALVHFHGLAAASTGAEYHLRSWTTDDGLPHNSTSRIVQDHAGYLWFATVGGLARFDGRELQPMRAPAEHRSLGLNIRGLAEERPGALLVLDTDQSLRRLTGSIWSIHPAANFLSALSDEPTNLHVDPAGNVWLATAEGRLLRWSPTNQPTVFGPDRDFASRPRRVTFATDVNGDFLVCADSLWVASGDGRLVKHPLAVHEPRMIATGRDGRLWLWTDRRLLQVERGRVIKEHVAPAEAEVGMIRHLFEDRRGAIWLATTRQGLLCLSEGRSRRVTDYSSVLFVTEDREGNIWVATDGNGIGQLREKPYQLFDAAAGLPQNIVSSVSEDATGRVWLATRFGGLMWIDADGRARASGLADPSRFVAVVGTDTQNRIWFGGGRNGLLRWNPDDGSAPVQLPAPVANLHLLFRANNNDMWFAADPDVLGFFRGDQLRLLTASDGFTAQGIRALAQDRDGAIWLGGREGELLCWDGTRFQRFGRAQDFPREPIHAIWPDAAGHIWIGTAGGLVVKDGDRFRVLTEEHGLVDDIIQQIVEDDRGNLWFAARRGLFYADKKQLLDVARGQAPRVESHRLGATDGLVGLSPTANFQPGAAKTRDGRLWFATLQGAVAVDPERVPHDLPPPPVLIDEVRLDGRLLSVDGPVRIPSGQHRVEFKFATLSYTAPENVFVRHQLEGIDPGWIDTRSDRRVSYASLPPGNYVLRVIARNSAGQWNTTGATRAVVIVPAWWETMSFRLGGLALLLGLTAWSARTLVRRRLQQRLARLEHEHALENERRRIARDLHDDLGASLTELGLVAHRLATTPAAEVAPQLTGLAWRTRRLSTDLAGIVWTMSGKNTTFQRLAEFLRRYAEDLFCHTTIHCVVKGTEEIPAAPITPDQQHQLLATTKEILNNLIKHAQATEAQVQMRWADEAFELTVTDNGIGFAFDADALRDGNGLRNMAARMQEIDGTLAVSSRPGQGTTVTLRLAGAKRASRVAASS